MSTPAEFTQKLWDLAPYRIGWRAEATQAIAERDAESEGVIRLQADAIRACVDSENAVRADNARLTKRLEEANRLIFEYSDPAVDGTRWGDRRNTYIASITPPPADSLVAAGQPAGYCGKAHKTKFGGFVCNRTDLHEAAKCAWNHERWTPPVAPGPLDVEASISDLQQTWALERRRSEELAAKVEALQSQVNKQAEAMEALRRELRDHVNERCNEAAEKFNAHLRIEHSEAAPPAPVAEPVCRHGVSSIEGHHCRICEYEPEAAEAGQHVHQCAMWGNACRSSSCTKCRAGCGKIPSDPIHAMPKASK
jgi:hypothetical protein